MCDRRTILSVGFLAAFAIQLTAGEKVADKPKRLTVADCEKLVSQLANPEKPRFTDIYVLSLPKGMSEHEKTFKKIGEAYDTLSKNIEVALPVLMKHRNDERYSFVQEQPISGVYSKISVGWACSTIVQKHVEAHVKKTFCHDGEGRPRGYYFIDHCGGLDTWWETRKDKTLAELQLEAMEWVMKQKQPKAFKSKAAWKEALKGVETMADDIRKTKKPVVVEHRVYFNGGR